MSDFFFFTDLDLLMNQGSNQAYGPVLSSDPIYDSNKQSYRLTSVHSATTNPLAYAVCKGQVCVQQNEANSSLVNIILKPERQPNSNIPAVKYFIYRGILKSSLTNGTDVINGNTTLTNSILDNNASTPQKVLGIELQGTNYNDTDPIDHLFYIPKPDYQLWLADGGWSIGRFNKDEFGFEIILEKPGFTPTLAIARAQTNIFKVDTLSGTPSQADLFDQKTKKEAILNFIDPCAFYGNFYDSKIFARKSTDSSDPELIHSFSKKKKDEIYREIIEGGTTAIPKNLFFNKNLVYVDIRNDQNFSFNYFENYSDSIKVSFSDDNIEPSVALNYYSMGWPILAISNLPVGTNKSVIRIAFPANKFNKSLVCVLHGERRITLKERVKNGKSDFAEFDNDPITQFSASSLFLYSPNYNNSIPVSQYLKIKYIDRSTDADEFIVNAYSPVKHDPFDFIFQPSLMSQPFQNGNIKVNIYDENVYVDLLSSYNIDYTGTIGIATDPTNTALFWSLSKRNTKPRLKAQAPSFSISRSIDNTFNYFAKYLEQKSSQKFVSTDIQVDSGTVQLIKEANTKFSFLSKRNHIDMDTEFYSIILSNTDFASVVSIANSSFDALYPPFLCFGNKKKLIDGNGKYYMKYDLNLKGLIRNMNDIMEMHEVSTPVSIYGFPPEDLK